MPIILYTNQNIYKLSETGVWKVFNSKQIPATQNIIGQVNNARLKGLFGLTYLSLSPSISTCDLWDGYKMLIETAYVMSIPKVLQDNLWKHLIAYMKAVWFYFIVYYKNSLYISTL
jgi:hypothetical protein